MKNTDLAEFVFREATPDDIKEIQIIRNSVTENVLSNPDLVTDELCLEYLTARGKGWVCVGKVNILGFSIIDLRGRNVWALFVKPGHERKGIGRQLQNLMLDWYFSRTSERIWLSTDPHTRAEKFYRFSGWIDSGVRENGEIKFEMSFEDWNNKNSVDI